MNNRQIQELIRMLQRHQGTLLRTLNLSGTKIGTVITMIITGASIIFLSQHNDHAPSSSTTTQPPMQAEKGDLIPCVLERIIDGDTVVANCNGAAGTRIRMAKMDAPEMGQKPVGDKSREYLEQILPRHFTLNYEGTDFYKRALGVLYRDQENINLKMISDGYAFAYDGKGTPQNYRDAEEAAKSNRVGLWGAYPKEMTNPKTWRRYNK